MERKKARNYVLSNIEEIDQSWKFPTEKEKGRKLTYLYSSNEVIDDCKFLIKQANQNSNDPRAVLLALIGWGKVEKTEFKPTLYFIHQTGFETEIKEYTAIGSGYPYTKVIFEVLYNPDKSMIELVRNALATIVFTIQIAGEGTVGYNKQNYPQVYAILNSRSLKIFDKDNSNILEVIDELEEKMRKIKNKIIETINTIELSEK